MKTFIFYENNPEATMEQFMEVYPRHQENEEKFIKAGKKLLIYGLSTLVFQVVLALILISLLIK